MALAIAQPILDLLARHPPFLVAHRVAAVELALLVLGLVAGIPALLLLLEALAGRLGAGVRRAVHLGLVALLFGVLALPVLHRLAGAPDALALAAAAAVGGAGAIGYARIAALRSLLALASPAALVVAGVFFARAEVRELLAPAPASAAPARVANPAPVVFVVFDGLRLADLLDAGGSVDAGRYPGFAALAALSTWYRNTTTVAESTVLALPAILTGRYPDPTRPPTLHANPGNLFTLLARSHEIWCFEPVTGLCPEGVRRELLEPRGPGASARALGLDLGVLYLHWLLPPGVASDRLPPLGERWAHFQGSARETGAPEDRGGRSADRLAVFESFLATLEPRVPGAKPRLHFVHLLLPHSPYRYLPSGRTFNPPRQELRAWREGLGEAWQPDPQGTLQAEKLYLMQVALVDTLVARLLERLRGSGLLDESLVVVTSDHGESFRAGHGRRIADDETRPDILPIPLFVKAPGQRQGRIDDAPLESIDILPTLATVVGAEPPWPVDGRAAAAGGEPRRERWLQRRTGRLALPVDPAPWRPALERKLALFGSGTPSEQLLRVGPMARLVGAAVPELAPGGSAPYAYELLDAGLYASVDPDGPSIPAFVHGWIRSDAGSEGRPPLLALAIEGRVAAVSSGFPGPDGALRFQALVAESAFRPGRNRVDLYALRPDGPRVLFLPIPALAERRVQVGR